MNAIRFPQHRIRVPSVAGAVLVAALSLAVDEARGQSSLYQRDDPALTLLTANGGRVEWSPDGEWIYYDRKEGDCYALYRIPADSDGDDEGDAEELTAGLDFPVHHGNPAIHPDGRWLVFQAQAEGGCELFWRDPGRGARNVLWLMDLESDPPYDVYQLTDTTNEGGALHPHFSNAGDKLVWGDRESGGGSVVGDWQIAVAGFTDSDTQVSCEGPRASLGPPCLYNRANYDPAADDEWYETHGFGPDDSWIYFSCTDVPNQPLLGGDICRMCLDDSDPEETPLTCETSEGPASAGPVVRLTRTSGEEMVTGTPESKELRSWDEHAHLSPLEDAMVWETNHPVGAGGTDLWLMNPDGTEKWQLTHFNRPLHDDQAVIQDHPEHGVGFEITEFALADSAWSPDGTKIAVKVNFPESEEVPEHIWIVHLTRDNAPLLSWRQPTSEVEDTGGDGTGFEVQADKAFAPGDLHAWNVDGVQDRHRFYDYGFSVPTGAVVDGIEVRLDWVTDSLTWGPRLQVDLSWDGGTNWTSQKTTLVGGLVFLSHILGGETDTWGRTWSTTSMQNDFTNANFRVRVRATCASENLCTSRDYKLDWVPVRVLYH